MKQKKYIIKLLLKTWLGILCFSLLCTFCAVWLLFQNTKQSSYDNINIAYEGILLTWAIIGVIMFSAGTITLFMNYFPVIRYNNIYSFLSFFLVPLLLILWCGTETLSFRIVAIPFIICLSGAYCKHPIKYPFSLLYFHCTFAFAILHELLTYFHYDTRTI